MYLTIADYAVTIAILLVPLAMGFFYAWKDSKNVDREEYLLGGRKMKMLPVSLSTFVSFQSAISLIGIPGDIYRYGIMACAVYIGGGLGTLLGCFTMVPLMHPLKLNNIYEYLEMRYESRAVKILGTVFGMVDMFFYMVIAMVAPGLALQAGANIPFWVSVAVVGGIGTLYTAIGGIKSVIWTDVFQAFIIATGLFLIIIRGTMAVGGSDKVWHVAEEGGRTSMDAFSPDPRTRHTWWGMVMGGTAFWLTSVFNQAGFQRVAAVETTEKARRALLLNIPFAIFYSILLGTVGIILYSYFYVIRCDPLEAGLVSNMNHVSLYFMLHIFQDSPGLAGLYMGTIFSGALSTLSSGINSLAANTVENILPGKLRGVSEMTATIVTKVLVFVFGIVIVGVAYLFKSLPGSVSQISSSITGIFGSVTVCTFVTGCIVPWANKYGVFVGSFVSVAFNLWIAIGNLYHGKRPRPLPSPPTDGCSSDVAQRDLYNSTFSSSVPNGNWSCSAMPIIINADDPHQYGFFLYDISYEWYGVIGITVGCLVNLITSKVTNDQNQTKTDPKLIIPSLRKFWKLDDVPSMDENEPCSLHDVQMVI